MSAVSDIQLIINDAGVFWPQQQLLDALNEAQLAVYAETKWALTTASLTLTSNADIVAMPDGVFLPKWIEGTNVQFQPPVVKRFFPTTMRNLETFLRTWRGNNVGQPGWFIQWDATHWRVFPRPDGLGAGTGGSYPFTVYGVGYPTEITSASQSLLGPATYVLAVQNLAVSLLMEATRPDLADAYAAQHDEQVLAFKKQQRNNQSHNIRILKPASTVLEIQQFGQISAVPMYFPVEC